MQIPLRLPQPKISFGNKSEARLASCDVPYFLTIGGAPKTNLYNFQYDGGQKEETLTKPIHCTNGIVHVGKNSGRIWMINSWSVDHAIDAVIELIQNFGTSSEESGTRKGLGTLMNYHVVHLALEHACASVSETDYNLGRSYEYFLAVNKTSKVNAE